jgi:ribosomal protein S18 acetylase RimI-like enzyme
MFRPHLREIPPAPLPAGFRIRGMSEADIPLWLMIERDAEPFLTIEDSLFLRDFGSDLPAISQRCFLIESTDGEPAGTISAWYETVPPATETGRIHWVAVRPRFQRRGLARAGMSHALTQLARWHSRAVLGTSTARIGAIALYLEYGFVPQIDSPDDRQAWSNVAAEINHPLLIK